MANKKYKLTDGNMWATDGIHDFGQNKTQRTINSEVNTALGGKAPTDHASTSTTYGKGTSSNYGHVKISDSLTDTTPAATGGVVPSMKAVSDLNGALNAITPLDTTPTNGSTKGVTSGGTYNEITNRSYYKTVANGATLTLQTGAGHNYMIIGLRVNSIGQNYGMYVIDAWGGILKIQETTAMQVSLSNTVISITNNSGGYLNVIIMDFYEK